MAFRVGQKVVCVDAKRTNNRDIAELEERAVYTIRWTNGPHVRLMESTLRTVFGGDHPYGAHRFRPLVERKTDISVFEKMLNPSVEQLRELIRESSAC